MNQKKILTIEDDIDLLKNLETILTEEGYQTITANNGYDGIELAKKNEPDLIICDIAMPGIDGYQVLEQLSKDKVTRLIPFIFLTAKVEKEDIRKGMQLGADDYIFKPFTLDDLLNAISTRLKRINVLKSEAEIKTSETEKNKYTEDGNFFVHVNDKPQLVKVKDIVYISAENQYTLIKRINEKSFLARKSVSSWEEQLPETKFLRIHRSTIINIDYIVKIEKFFNSSFLIYMKNTVEPFVVSKRYAAKLRQNMI